MVASATSLHVALRGAVACIRTEDAGSRRRGNEALASSNLRSEIEGINLSVIARICHELVDLIRPLSFHVFNLQYG